MDSGTKSIRKYPRLWHDPKNEIDGNGTHDNGTSNAPHLLGNNNEIDNEAREDSFLRARRMRNVDLVSLSLPTPRRRSFWEISANSLVVGQEVALSCLLLAGHRVIMNDKEWGLLTGEIVVQESDRWTPMFSIGLLYVSFMIVIYYRDIRSRKGASKEAIESMTNDKLSTKVPDSEGGNKNEIRRPLMRKRDKMVLRSTDSLILAVLLRFLLAVLRSLTASYSSDTVAALAITGMVVHVLACDYQYANGNDTPLTIPSRPANKMERPTFRGGIVSLNAALFSTTLLASRLSSNSAAYAFVTYSVILFAFYPDARHTMASNSSHHGVFPCFLMTVTLSLATFILLNSTEKTAFVAVLFCILIVSPLLKWWLQRYKEIITGPWDIVHITVDNSNSS